MNKSKKYITYIKKIYMTNDIILKPWDFYVKVLDDGREVIQLKGSVAFNEQFIEDCKTLGVRNEVIDEKDRE